MVLVVAGFSLRWRCRKLAVCPQAETCGCRRLSDERPAKLRCTVTADGNRHMKHVRVGNGCGFWGDNVDAPLLLAEQGKPDYLTLEYLAELTMSILALQKQRDPQLGFAGDFLDVLARLVPQM